jgi:hypothetical protein
MPGELHPDVKCRKCGKDVSMVGHVWGGGKATFEYVHQDESPDCIVETDWDTGEKWLAEENGKPFGEFLKIDGDKPNG